MFVTRKHAKNETCVEVYSRYCGYFARQISHVSCFEPFWSRSGKITKSKGFSRKKIYLKENRTVILVQRNCFSQDSHKMSLWLSRELSVAGYSCLACYQGISAVFAINNDEKQLVGCSPGLNDLMRGLRSCLLIQSDFLQFKNNCLRK